MDNLYLIARIADTRVALRSRSIEAVVMIGEWVPAPGTLPKVVGLFALRSRVITIIDTHIVIGFPPSEIAPGQRVVIVNVEGHGYALIADEIEDVCFIDTDEEPTQSCLSSGWSQVAEAVIEYDSALLLVVDPTSFVTFQAKTETRVTRVARVVQ